MKEALLAILVFYPFAGGILSWCVGLKWEKARDCLADLLTAGEFVLALLLLLQYDGAQSYSCALSGVCGFGLHFTLDGFRALYAAIAGLMWMMTTILSREYLAHQENRNRFYLFMLLTLGATMGVFLSADLYTTFIFFEIMSFTSYVWVAQEENERSLRAASTYLTVAVLGGLVMLMGIFLLYHTLGTLEIEELRAAAAACQNKGILYAAGACMLFGFGAKAGAFPLHIWLPKAHPVAPAPASALLSGILTKTGIYGVLAISTTLFFGDAAWAALVLAIGAATMFGGALLAVFSIDLKRTLACSSMSQIGFILIGVGMQGLLGEENALAVHGTLLHMMNHSLIKLVLFMAAGVIFMNAHALDLNQIRGFGRRKPLLKIIFLIGALAIGGIPMFSGYISKTLLHESIVEFGGSWLMKLLEYLFLFCGGLTVAYMTKLFVAIFVERNESEEVQQRYDDMRHYMNAQSTFALAGSALVLLVWGLLPYRLMDRAARLGQRFMQLEEFGETVSYFSFTNLLGGLVSIVIGALVYRLFIRKVLMQKKAGTKRPVYVDRWPSWLDLEERLYRPILLQFLPAVCGAFCTVLDRLVDVAVKYAMPVLAAFCRVFDTLPDMLVVGLRKSAYKDSPLPHERAEGTAFTEIFGKIANFFQNIGNHTWNRSHPSRKDYKHLLAVKHSERKESDMMIGRSLSFGLLLVCAGFCLTLIYILWF